MAWVVCSLFVLPISNHLNRVIVLMPMNHRIFTASFPISLANERLDTTLQGPNIGYNEPTQIAPFLAL